MAERKCSYVFDIAASSEDKPSLTAAATCQWSNLRSMLPNLHYNEHFRDSMDLIALIPSINSHMLTTAGSRARLIRSTAIRYLAFLPCRSGHSAALDSIMHCIAIAVRRLAMQYATLQTASSRNNVLYLDRNDANTLTSYANALQIFRSTLEDPKTSTSPETLCAAALFCYYEVNTQPALKKNGGLANNMLRQFTKKTSTACSDISKDFLRS